jgi:Leucine-rich repeat (LRR) protein
LCPSSIPLRSLVTVSIIGNNFKQEQAGMFTAIFDSSENNITSLCGISDHEHVTELDFSSKNMNAVDALLVARELPLCSSIASFNIASNNIGSVASKDMAEAIKYCTSLTSINLSSNKLTRGALTPGASRPYMDFDYETDITGIVALGAAIKDSSLTYLDVSNNNGDAEFVKHIVDGIKGCTSLVKLTMDKFELLIQHIKSATELDLSNKEIGVLDTIVIAALLPLNKSLTKLDLASNKLAEETGYIKKGEVTGDSLDAGDMVTYMGMRSAVSKAVDSDGELKVKPIEGLLALCDALNGNTTIQELNVASIGMEAQSAKHFATTLRTMT